MLKIFIAAVLSGLLGCASSVDKSSSASAQGGAGGGGGPAGQGGAGGQGGGAGGQGGGGSCDLLCEPMPLGTIVKIEIYEWNGETVYLTRGGCCDQYDELFTTSCAPICAPSGGKTGTGDGKCPTFYDEAVLLCTT